MLIPIDIIPSSIYLSHENYDSSVCYSKSLRCFNTLYDLNERSSYKRFDINITKLDITKYGIC